MNNNNYSFIMNYEFDKPLIEYKDINPYTFENLLKMNIDSNTKKLNKDISQLIIDKTNINYLIENNFVEYNNKYKSLIILVNVKSLIISLNDIKILYACNIGLEYLNIVNLTNIQELYCNHNRYLTLYLNSNINIKKMITDTQIEIIKENKIIDDY